MAKLVIEIPDELRDLGEALAPMVARVQGTVAGTGGGKAVDYGRVEQAVAEEAGASSAPRTAPFFRRWTSTCRPS